jgi:hypothetical protein
MGSDVVGCGTNTVYIDVEAPGINTDWESVPGINLLFLVLHFMV